MADKRAHAAKLSDASLQKYDAEQSRSAYMESQNKAHSGWAHFRYARCTGTLHQNASRGPMASLTTILSWIRQPSRV